METASSRVPVTVLTGFLGAGKTTLLNTLLASAGEDGTLALWRPGARGPLALAAPGSGIARIAWSPDDGRLAAGDEDGRVAVLTAPRERRVR